MEGGLGTFLRCWDWGLAFWSAEENIWATVWCRNLYCSWRRKSCHQGGKTKEERCVLGWGRGGPGAHTSVCTAVGRCFRISRTRSKRLKLGESIWGREMGPMSRQALVGRGPRYTGTHARPPHTWVRNNCLT